MMAADLSAHRSMSRSKGTRRRVKGSKDVSVPETLKILKQRGFNVMYDGAAVKPWYVIDPATNPHVAKWDFLMAMAIGVTALLTPYELAFIPPPRTVDSLFWFNRLVCRDRARALHYQIVPNLLALCHSPHPPVTLTFGPVPAQTDLVFAVDMVLMCFTMTAITSQIEGVRWVHTPRELFCIYARSGWFFIDVRRWGAYTALARSRPHRPQALTLSSSSFDLVTLFVSRDAGFMRKLKVLRVLRVLKLVRLAKLLRNSRLMQQLRLVENHRLRCGGTAALASPDPPKRQAAPTSLKAQPEQLGRSPWPR